MIYFDNAATGGRKPDQVLTAVGSALRVCANPGRSGHKLALTCARLVQDCRKDLNEFFHGYGFDRVAFTKNCTEALNVALFGALHKGDHVVTTCMEHNSVLRPLHALQTAGIITYDVCPLTGEKDKANVTAENIRALLRPNTRAVVVTTASNVNGAIPNLDKIRAVLPEQVLLICDGAQGCGHLAIDMQKMGVDALAVAGHKGMHGIQGSGALLFSERIDPAPFCYGGTGSISNSLDMPDFYPDRLEAGTLSFPAVISLLEGTRYLTLHGKRTQKKIIGLTEQLISGLAQMPDYVLYSAPNPCGIVAFAHRDYPSNYVARRLDEDFGIAVRSGLHCAPLMHEALGSAENGLVRASVSHFNSAKEIDLLLEGLRAVAREKARGLDLF
jgi:selenocysteine lyase/cysteine desulfurase